MRVILLKQESESQCCVMLKDDKFHHSIKNKFGYRHVMVAMIFLDMNEHMEDENFLTKIKERPR